MVETGSIPAEIFVKKTNVVRANVQWTNLTVTLGYGTRNLYLKGPYHFDKPPYTISNI